MERLRGQNELSHEELQRQVAALEVENASLHQRLERALIRIDDTLGPVQDHVAIYDSSWRYIYLNDAAAAVLGKPKEALIGKSIWNLFPDAVGNQYYEELHRAKETGEVIRSEHYYAPMGTWFLNHIYPSHGEVTVMSSDITERKQAEEKAARSQARYRALIEATSSGIWSWNPKTNQGDYEEVQRWWHRTTGQPPEEQEQAWTTMLHPDDRERVENEWATAISKGERLETEYRLISPDGRNMHIVSIAVPIVDADGNRIEWIGSMQEVTAAREALQELMTLKSKLEAIVEASPLAIVALNPAGEVQLWNATAESIFGWTQEEALGARMPAVPEDRMEEFQSNLEAVLDDKPATVTRSKRKRKDGELLDSTLWAAPLRGDDGKPEGMLVMIADVTEQRRREEELAASQEFLKIAMRSGQMGHWNRDLLTGEVSWSPELEALFGLEPGSFEGSEKNFFSYVHKDDLPILSEAVQESIRTRKEYSVEFRFNRADGTAGWMDGRGRTTYDADGTPIRIDGFGIDITARKSAEASIFESERRFRFLAETMPVIAWSLTADGNMDFINRRYFDYSGQDISTPQAEAWSSVLHPTDAQTAMAHYGRCIESGTVWEEKLRLKSKEGEFRWHLSRLEPVRDEYGTIIRWFGTSTDIHDQKEAETALEKRVEERTRELLDANRELEGFTYSVSHDLRAPLRAISSTSMILLQDLEDRLDPSERALLERQSYNATRLGVLIDALLKLSRIGRQELICTHCDLSQVAADAASELRAEEGDVKVQIEPGMSAEADLKLVRFVFLNLIENALKFSSPGGNVYIGTGEDGTIYVRDEGIGFDMRYVDKIFQPFERLVSDQDYPGTGIGLANAQRIVQRHGGQIWAESELGKGTTFFFTLRS